MNLPVRIIMFDMDGTLLNDEKTIDAPTCRVIHQLAQEGIIFGVASGRPIPTIETKLKAMNILQDFTLLVGNNGSSVKNIATGKYHIMHPIDKKDWLELMEMFPEDYIFPIIANETDIYVDRESEYSEKVSSGDYLICNVTPYRDVNATIIKACLYFRPENQQKVTKLFQERFHSENIVGKSAGAFSIEFTHKSTNKGIAAEYLAAQMGITPDQMMAFGDAENDEALLRSVRYPIAMVNGSDYIKSICYDTTTYDNNHNGIARYLLDHRSMLHLKKDIPNLDIYLGFIGALLFFGSEAVNTRFPISDPVMLVIHIIALGFLLAGIIVYRHRHPKIK